MRWSEKETLEFVRIYLRHEYLWNPDDVNYKLRYLRKEAYTNIVAELKDATGIVLDEAEVKIKIKNLRSTYLQELAKIRDRSSSDAVYRPNIKWFSEWHKCFDAVKRKHFPKRERVKYESDEPSDMWISLPSDNETVEATEEDPFESPTHEGYDNIFKSEPSESRNRSPTFESKKKLKRKHFSTDISDESIRSTESSTPFREDEFDIYGKYIASQLRNMDLQKAIRVQVEIQSIVSEARLSSLNGQ